MRSVRVLAIRLLDDNGRRPAQPPQGEEPAAGPLLPDRLRRWRRPASCRAAPGPPVLALIVGMDRPGGDGDDRRYTGFVFDLAKPADAETAE